MSAPEKSLLIGILALDFGFVTRKQFESATGRWLRNPTGDLGGELVARKLLTPSRLEFLKSFASRRAKSLGSTAKSLALASLPAKTHASLLRSASGRMRKTLLRVPVASANKTSRYVLGKELGRGGLGRVVEAEDVPIGRKVALKLLLEGAPLDVVQRFEREGRITGRLEHPNIVPVHEVGVLPGEKGEAAEAFFAMKRIWGRDLSEVIGELRRGKPAGEWTQRRLLEAFRDVCRAVAYAHSKEVIHRDLKPSNVMLGEFGEVLVVDWGLARLKGERTGQGPGQGQGQFGGGQLTLDGDVVGTPQYMPPEQAAGRMEEVDEQSDVYSLGAILFEILAWQAPFEGRTTSEVLNQVVSGAAPSPSSLVETIRKRAEGPALVKVRGKGRVGRPEVPAELEAICLKAMAREKSRRFRGAAELGAEMDAWLEGTRERERREKEAAALVERARGRMEDWKRLEGEAAAARAAAQKLHMGVPLWEGVERKRPAWEAAEKAEGLRRESLRALADAGEKLASALENVPGHRDARALKAEMAWRRFEQAERRFDEEAMQLHLREAEAANDGVLDARIRGTGSLEVRTRAFPCGCLSAGRVVRPDDLCVAGYRLWSGRAVRLEESEHRRSESGTEVPPTTPLPDLELKSVATWKVHGPACRAAELKGAHAWAFRHEEIDRRLVPVSAGTSSRPIPPALLDELFGDSPFRPRGPGDYLGRTPLPRRPWTMGSWLLVIAAEGFRPMRVPVNVGRQEAVQVLATCFGEEDLPRELVPIVEGSFLWQGDPEDKSSKALETRHEKDVAIQRLHVSSAEYLVYLNELAARDPGQAARRAPRESALAAPSWPCVEGRYVIPTSEWLSRHPAERERTRLMNAVADWEEDWPVYALTWEDGQAYFKWKSEREGRLYTYPGQAQWEKAARGPDGRFFPWGNRWDYSFCCNISSSPEGTRPQGREAFSTDESPWGVRGMAGHGREWCLDAFLKPGYREVRGGEWRAGPHLCRTTYRTFYMQDVPHVGTALRAISPLQLDP